jgi:hypothetical protein
MALYVSREPAMVFVEVPGDSRQCKVVSDTVRNTTTALVYWMIRLHSHGFSLDGTLIIDGFCVHFNGSLKGTGALFHKLVPLDDVCRSRDMTALANFARQHLYQIQHFGPVPPEVQDLLDILTAFTADQYLLLKSHPAHEDAIGQSAIFTKLYGLLMALKTRDMNRFLNAMGNMNNAINSPAWICDGVKNLYLHQLMRFTSNPGANGLFTNIVNFLSNNVKCGGGTGEGCLKVRRNGESHLSQDYCGVPAAMGTEEAFRAAIAAATKKIPALVMSAPYPQNFQALLPTLDAPFRPNEARVVATAITDALRLYGHSTVEADAAATAAARYLGRQQTIYISNPPVFVPPPRGMHPNQAQAWQTQRRQQALQHYQQQQANTRVIAAQAAQTAQQRLLQVRAAPHPLMSRNMFDVKMSQICLISWSQGCFVYCTGLCSLKGNSKNWSGIGSTKKCIYHLKM